MHLLEDFGLYVVRLLAVAAQWLDRATGPVPWPIVMALAALPVLVVLRWIVWFLRGTVWPVRCKYPVTTQNRHDKACRTMVAGEWGYCRNHNRPKRMSNGHVVQPDLPRWQTFSRGQRVDRSDVRAVGDSVSLLFYRGFARSPRQVAAAFPEVLEARKETLRAAWHRIRRLPVAATAASTAPLGPYEGPTHEELETYRAVNVRAERADQALMMLRFTLPVALLVTALSSFVGGLWSIVVEYTALLLLWVSVEVARHGLLRDPEAEQAWIAQVAKSVARAFGVVVGVAVIAAALDAYVIPFIQSIYAPPA